VRARVLEGVTLGVVGVMGVVAEDIGRNFVDGDRFVDGLFEEGVLLFVGPLMTTI